MQHIGIVACSAEGAALCYQSICRAGFAALGKHHHPRITMDAIPLAEWMPAFEGGDAQGVADVMLRSARVLAGAGCDFLICPDNSAHLAWEQVQAATPLPWLHIVEVVGRAAVAGGHRTVGVLGTRFTMEGHAYPSVLSAMGLEVLVPGEDDRAIVDRVIFDELVDGVVTERARRASVAVIERLAAAGADAVALACTELPLLITPESSPLPTLDSTRLLATAALERAMGA